MAAATRAGFTTLNVDRLGYGHSDRPFSVPVDFTSNARVTHQVAQHVCTGALGSFDKIVLVGHSMGGFTAVMATGTYPGDYDGVIVADASHNINWITVSQVAGNFYPAEFDPKFKDRGYPPGFTTTRPGTRGEFLYNKQGSDPAVWSEDERRKDTVNAGEWATLAFDAANPKPADQIRIPVLMAFGEDDNFYRLEKCSAPGSAAQLERHYFPHAPCYDRTSNPRQGTAGVCTVRHHSSSQPLWTGRCGASATNPRRRSPVGRTRAGPRPVRPRAWRRAR